MPANGPPPILHAITITLDEANGQLKVLGVPPNKVLALGMLRVAEEVVLKMTAPKESPIMKLPPGARLG